MPIMPVIVAGSTLPTLFNTREVAEMFHVTPRTVAGWIRDGHLRGMRFGRSYLVAEGDIEALVRTRFLITDEPELPPVSPVPAPVVVAPPPAPAPVPVTAPPTSKKTRPSFAPSGQLGELVRLVCDDIAAGIIIEVSDQPWTPHRLARLVAIRAPHIYATTLPSTGAIADILKRWRQVGFVEVTESPMAFLRFTDEAKTVGLSALKTRYRAARRLP